MGHPDRFVSLLKSALLDAWALVQPVECLGCGLPDRALCRECREALRPGDPCRVRCDADPGVPVLVGSDYAGPIRAAVLAFKEDGRIDAARSLAPLLRSALARLLPAAEVTGDGRGIEIVPVPSRVASLRRRGYDPVRELLVAVRLPSARVLAARGTGTQKSRTRAARLAAAGRFRARGRLEGRRFLLVDDVVTTGATIAACAAALRAAGGTIVGAAAVCAPDLGARRIPMRRA